MSCSWVAVPPDTVSAIIALICSSTPAGRGTGVSSAVAGCPATIAGMGTDPWASVAATSAIPNGDAVTLPCPMPSSTRSADVSATGTDPVTVVMPGAVKSTPRPS